VVIIRAWLVKSIVGCFCVGIFALAGVAQLKPPSKPKKLPTASLKVDDPRWSERWLNEDVR
jgi:hypothetical protein